MLQMSMSKLSLKVLLGVFALMFSASVGLSAECKDDPNECTPKNLCEVATQVINDNKVWSEDASAAEHITFVKEIGMECGVVEITDPCDLDPNECKVKQLCEKATTGDDGSKSWNADAEAYVELAREYSLSCGVTKSLPNNDTSTNLSELDNSAICVMAVKFNGSSSYRWRTWEKRTKFQPHVKEAKLRGLSCGVEGSAQKEDCTVANINSCDTTSVVKKSNDIPYYKKKNGAEFKSAFKRQSTLKRKQIQYALKELGFYSKGIDGLWGKGTSRALTNWLRVNNPKATNPENVFVKILGSVNVPTSFASTSKNRTLNNNQNSAAARAERQRQSEFLLNLGAQMMRQGGPKALPPSRSQNCTVWGGFNTNQYDVWCD